MLMGTNDNDSLCLVVGSNSRKPIFSDSFPVWVNNIIMQCIVFSVGLIVWFVRLLFFVDQSCKILRRATT